VGAVFPPCTTHSPCKDRPEVVGDIQGICASFLRSEPRPMPRRPALTIVPDVARLGSKTRSAPTGVRHYEPDGVS
jgi:hypothetical protein